MQKLVDTLKSGLLPECFTLWSETLIQEDPVEFQRTSRDNSCLIELLGTDNEVFIDAYESSFLAPLALSLWFMEFDEDNWFSFNEVLGFLEPVFQKRAKKSEMIELRLIKGTFPPMILDLPVLLDHKTSTISVLRGKLED